MMNTNFSTLPAHKKAQNEIILTPLKGNTRRDSVEIIGEDNMTPLVMRRRVSSTPTRASNFLRSQVHRTAKKSSFTKINRGSKLVSTTEMTSTVFTPPTHNKTSPIQQGLSFVRKSSKCPEKRATNTPKSSLIGVTQRATVNRLSCKEDINVEELEWKQYHIAMFETILVFFEGSDCRFESRIELGAIRSIKRIRIDKKVGLMVVLQHKPVSMLLRFRNRAIRQQWYAQLNRKNVGNFSKGVRASNRSEKSYNLTNLNISGSECQEEDDDVFDHDEVFDNEETEPTDLMTSQTCGRPRTRSCPDENDISESPVHKPTFQSLRKSKKLGRISHTRSNKCKRTLFDSIKQKASNLKGRLMR